MRVSMTLVSIGVILRSLEVRSIEYAIAGQGKTESVMR